MNEQTFHGIPGAPGQAAGPAFFRELAEIPSFPETTENARISAELERFADAKTRFRVHLESLPETEELRDVYLELLDDEELARDVSDRIQNQSRTAPAAIRDSLDESASVLRELADEYASQRADDLLFLRDGLLRAVLHLPLKENQWPTGPFVLIGKEISPLNLMDAPPELLLGIVSAEGGRTSHAALLAAGREIPAVMGLGDALREIQNGEPIRIDGTEGTVIKLGVRSEELGVTLTRTQTPSPNGSSLSETFITRKRQLITPNSSLLTHFTPHSTLHTLMMNLSDPGAIGAVKKYGAAGVGLFRTEFLFLRPAPPNEEEQFTIYRKLAEMLEGKPLTIRTFDVGADKPIPAIPMKPEPNPFLGVRGCRVYAQNQDLFQTQLRAILRASAFGNVRVMFPMVTCKEEVVQLLAWVEEAKNALLATGTEFNAEIPVGLMIETPAAALLAEELAPMVDFFSLGTNDLTQYTLAADRGNPATAALYGTVHPAVLRLLRETIEAAHRFGKPVGMCGELAARPDLAQTFLEYGLDSWSMTPQAIPKVRAVLEQKAEKE